jgi:membrane protein
VTVATGREFASPAGLSCGPLPGLYRSGTCVRAPHFKTLVPGRYYQEVPLHDAMRRHIRATLEFFSHLFARVREDRLAQVSGSLTFTTLLALVPLLTVTLTVFSAFPVFAGFSGAIRSFILENLIPAASGRVITVYMQQFAENAGKLTTAGLAILGVAAAMMMLTIDRTFNTVWRVAKPRALVSRLLIYWGALTIGPLLIGASLSLTSWMVALSLELTRDIGWIGVVLLKTVPIFLTSLAFAFLYKTVPARRVDVNDAVAGGLMAGLLFEGMKAAFGAYLRQVPTYKLVYGAFASFPIFLLWIYFSWLIILVGAELTAAMPYLRAGGVKRRRLPGNQFVDAVQLLRLLHKAHQKGEVPSVEELRAALRLPVEKCEALLERLAAAGWAARAANDHWVLARDADEIRLSEVYHEFVFRSAELHEGAENAFERQLVRLTGGVQEDLSMTLARLFGTPPQEPARARAA